MTLALGKLPLQLCPGYHHPPPPSVYRRPFTTTPPPSLHRPIHCHPFSSGPACPYSAPFLYSSLTGLAGLMTCGLFRLHAFNIREYITTTISDTSRPLLEVSWHLTLNQLQATWSVRQSHWWNKRRWWAETI